MQKLFKILAFVAMFGIFGTAALADPTSGAGTGVGNGIVSRP